MIYAFGYLALLSLVLLFNAGASVASGNQEEENV